MESLFPAILAMYSGIVMTAFYVGGQIALRYG